MTQTRTYTYSYSWVGPSSERGIVLRYRRAIAKGLRIDIERVNVRSEALENDSVELFVQIDGRPVTETEAITLEPVIGFFTITQTGK